MWTNNDGHLFSLWPLHSFDQLWSIFFYILVFLFLFSIIIIVIIFLSSIIGWGIWVGLWDPKLKEELDFGMCFTLNVDWIIFLPMPMLLCLFHLHITIVWLHCLFSLSIIACRLFPTNIQNPLHIFPSKPQMKIGKK